MDIKLVMFKDDERRAFPVKSERVVIGRALECDLRIPTGDVSREHCEITHDDVIVHVRDMSSANGTFVNGKRVSEAQLRAGDKLSVGPVVFVIQIDGEPAKITPHDARVEKAAEPVAAAQNLEDTGDMDDDIFAEITGTAKDGGEGDQEFDLDSIEILDDDEEEST